ncbi:MAG: NHL repeat-containing protein [Deltaproteobacteria bacterium]|nr:NHL repeat-containing protein [Deltaproteobacteria bacterium]
MKLTTAIKVGRTIIIVAAVFMVAGRLAFVPSAKEPSYRFVTAWGEKGDAPGQFNDPTGIAVAGDEVFVADSRNGRIQVFDLDGHFKRQFGSPGDGPGRLGRPMNLTVHEGELYVAEYFNDRIQMFALDGTPKRTIGKPGSGPGEFNAPGGVAVAPNGDLFIADFYNQRIQHLKANGRFVRQWGTTGKIGIWAEEFNYPTDAALGPDGILYVADGYNDRIQVFGSDETFLRKWGGPFAMNIFGPFNGWFATVTNVTVDRKGDVFVADFYNHRIQKFAADGTFLTRFGTKGSGPGQFNHAIAVAAADDGTVFAVDFGNNRVGKWRQGMSYER